MKKYLVENKIPPSNILVDNFGDNTEKTVINTIKIADSLKYSHIISVSQFYHQTRIKKLFRENHFKNIESSSPMYFELRDFYSVFREFFAYYLSLSRFKTLTRIDGYSEINQYNRELLKYVTAQLLKKQ